MRELEITLGGRQLTLAATFKASQDIAKHVADPLTIVREAGLEALFLSQNIPYEPKWRFTIENVVQIFWFGLKAAGSNLELTDLQDLIFDEGFISARDKAGDYLAMIVGPQPTEVTPGKASEGN